MEYKVIIDLTRAKTRRVGEFVSVLEDMGLELVEVRKRASCGGVLSGLSSYGMLYRQIFKSDLSDQPAMDFYRRKFSEEVLEKKLDILFENHVELTFDSEEAIDPNKIWEELVEKLYRNNLKKLPFMFVLGSRPTHCYEFVA